MWYLSFCAWFITLNTMSFWLICVSSHDRNFFDGWIYFIALSLYIQPFMNVFVDSKSWLLWIMVNKYVYTCIFLAFWFLFLWIYTQWGIVGSYYSFSFVSIRNFHIVSHTGYANLHSSQQCLRVLCSLHPHQHILLFYVFLMVVIPICLRCLLIAVLICVYLHDYLLWAFFPIFDYHLYFFSWKISIFVIGPFFT